MERRGKGDVKWRMKGRNKLNKFEKRLQALEGTQEAILSGRSTGAPSGEPVAGRGGSEEVWGTAGVPLPPAAGGKKQRGSGAPAADGDGECEDDASIAASDMHAVAEELVQVLKSCHACADDALVRASDHGMMSACHPL